MGFRSEMRRIARTKAHQLGPWKHLPEVPHGRGNDGPPVPADDVATCRKCKGRASRLAYQRYGGADVPECTEALKAELAALRAL